jgi:hexosaminidase
VPFAPTGDGQVPLTSIKSIIVDAEFASARDDKGETLIPPTLESFAATFAQDLGNALEANISVQSGSSSCADAVFLTIGDAHDYLDAAGRNRSEGYSLSVSEDGIVITGASPLGAWWGTRTLLQQAAISNGSIPYGNVKDSPGWNTRGMMLDAGRHYYPPEFLTEMCAYMSFFKQNTFHVHLSDNLYNSPDYTRDQSLNLYARFRLWSDSSDVEGLSKYKNESYTKEEFDQIQSTCAARGVTIIPEIEAPGHALVIVQWKPELGYSSDLSLLNITRPETIPTMQRIWKTFLPWFHTKSVHIGADEYTGPANDYNLFVNALAGYIGETCGKSIRIWGTFPPNDTAGYVNIYKNVTVQHWEYFEDNPLTDYVLNNISVINSDDSFYVVNKWSGSYPQQVNVSRTFVGNPENDSLWYPYVFDVNNATDNPKRSNPLVPGQIGALWNDYGANATVYTEAYYAWREGIPALADKQWGGDLMASEFDTVLRKLRPHIPAQNLDRSIPSKSATILNYTMAALKSYSSNDSRVIQDQSGNSYDAETSCESNNDGSIAISPSCTFSTPFSSKGRDYTLTLSLTIDELISPSNATVISGSDSMLMLTPNITLFASGNYYRLNSSLPLGQTLDLTITGRGNQTFASVTDATPVGDASSDQEFLTRMGINGEYFHWAPMGIEAPLKQIGGEGIGWSGKLYGMTLTGTA